MLIRVHKVCRRASRRLSPLTKMVMGQTRLHIRWVQGRLHTGGRRGPRRWRRNTTRTPRESPKAARASDQMADSIIINKQKTRQV